MTGPDPTTLDAVEQMVVGDALGKVPLPVQLLVAALVVGTAAWAAVRPRLLPSVAFVACSLMWARANQALEGPVLVTFSHDHGLVVADLLPPGLLVLVLARWVSVRRMSARSHRAGPTRDPVATGYPAQHGSLRVRLRPAAVAAAALPRHPSGGGPRRRR